MLHFIYHFEYTNESKESAMVFHAKVYQIADKYGILALKESAKKNFSPAVMAGWSTEEFPIAIDIVYTTTPSEDRGLRDLVVEISNANLETLISRDGFCQALRTTVDSAADLVPFTCGRISERIHCYRCPRCTQTFSI
jgi:speckle-type POZ protein